MEGLRAALQTLVRQFDCDRLRCTLQGVTHHEAHDAEVETHLYRIAQEAISNAVKHSKARKVELRYECNGRSINLEVLDDGTGLPQLQASGGSGLRNMQYRVHMISGNLDVGQRPNGGTRVVCSCPCRIEHDNPGSPDRSRLFAWDDRKSSTPRK
jgi:signal transduction histidine kinase